MATLDELVASLERIEDQQNDVIADNAVTRSEVRLASRSWKVVILVVVVAILVVGWFLIRLDRAVDKANGAAAEAKHNTDEIIEARKEGRASVCDGFEAFTNALAGTSERDPAELREIARGFEADLERRLGPLDCDIHVDILTEP